MDCKIHCTFILATAPIILGLKLQVDGKMDFGPKWNYEYRIKPLETEIISPRTFTAMNSHELSSNNEHEQPRFIDIIIKNNKSNPRLIQVAEAHVFDRKDKNKRQRDTRDDQSERKDDIQNIVNLFNKISDGKNKNKYKNKKHANKDKGPIVFSEEHPLVLSDEHTDPPNPPNMENKLTKTGKYVHHLVRIADDLDAPKLAKLEEFEEPPPAVFDEENNYRATIMMPDQKKKHKRHRKKKRATKTESLVIKPNEPSERITPKFVTVESFPPVTAVEDSFTVQNIYITSRLVKDDPKIKEFTRHIYEQSIKTLESIKEKMNNYEMKKQADILMRSYEEKFGEFVRETQNQKIRTRTGSQKVILNTLDTSNRILDRLVNYMIGDMDKRGILRNAGNENVVLNELNKKKDLENKHICAKMKICPTQESYTKFVVDILGTILNAPDNKIIQIRDAFTEVLKNKDFSDVLDHDTEKHLHKSIGDIEKFDVATMRPLFFILRNIVSSKNSPIKVVGPEDERVNKTLAFLDMLDNWEKKLPPNEQNVLEWNDMRNSFNEWRIGKRHDTVDLIQHFTDHVTKVISKEDARLFDRNINTIIGNKVS